MWENITIAGRVLLVGLAMYGVYSLYLSHKNNKK